MATEFHPFGCSDLWSAQTWQAALLSIEDICALNTAESLPIVVGIYSTIGLRKGYGDEAIYLPYFNIYFYVTFKRPKFLD